MRRALRRFIDVICIAAAGGCSGWVSTEGAAPDETRPDVASCRVQADTLTAPSTASSSAPVDDEPPAPLDPAPVAGPPGRGVPCYVPALERHGECIPIAACAALGAHISTPGSCQGPATIACCTTQPVADEHPCPPAGWSPMPQSRVTPQMTAWALRIVGSAGEYPMGSKTTEHFGSGVVMARVEWHPPDLGHSVVHRGVTLYQPAQASEASLHPGDDERRDARGLGRTQAMAIGSIGRSRSDL
jgi:hypothetical protein